MAALKRQADFPPSPPVVEVFDPRKELLSPPRARRFQKRRDEKRNGSGRTVNSSSNFRSMSSTAIEQSIYSSRLSTPLKEKEIKLTSVSSPFMEIDVLLQDQKSKPDVVAFVARKTVPQEEKVQPSKAIERQPKVVRPAAATAKPNTTATQSKTTSTLNAKNAVPPARSLARDGKSKRGSKPKTVKEQRKVPVLDGEELLVLASETQEDRGQTTAEKDDTSKEKIPQSDKNKASPMSGTRGEVGHTSPNFNARPSKDSEVDPKKSGPRGGKDRETTFPNESGHAAMPVPKTPVLDSEEMNGKAESSIDKVTRDASNTSVGMSADQSEDVVLPNTDFTEEPMAKDFPPSSPSRFLQWKNDALITSDYDLEYVDAEPKQPSPEKVEASRKEVANPGNEGGDKKAVTRARKKSSKGNEKALSSASKARSTVKPRPTESSHRARSQEEQPVVLTVLEREALYLGGSDAEGTDDEPIVLSITKCTPLADEAGTKDSKKESKDHTPQTKAQMESKAEIRRDDLEKAVTAVEAGKDEEVVRKAMMSDSMLNSAAMGGLLRVDDDDDDFGFGQAERKAEELMKGKSKSGGLGHFSLKTSLETVERKEDVDSQTQTQGQFTIPVAQKNTPALQAGKITSSSPHHEEDDEDLPLFQFKPCQSAKGTVSKDRMTTKGEEPVVDTSSELSDAEDELDRQIPNKKAAKQKGRKKNWASMKGSEKATEKEGPMTPEAVIAMLQSDDDVPEKMKTKRVRRGMAGVSKKTTEKGRKLDLNSQEDVRVQVKPQRKRGLDMTEDGSSSAVRISRTPSATLPLDDYSLPPGMSMKDWHASIGVPAGKKAATSGGKAVAANRALTKAKNKRRTPVPSLTRSAVGGQEDDEDDEGEDEYLMSAGAPRKRKRRAFKPMLNDEETQPIVIPGPKKGKKRKLEQESDDERQITEAFRKRNEMKAYFDELDKQKLNFV
ncbi:hypothetical protein CBS101457_005674 [Exobasidium rhododendri]|nr:hypothetical protein CBS101457_005674 [Exobasidium rhododendri]